LAVRGSTVTHVKEKAKEESAKKGELAKKGAKAK
jgi:hypothetical protein